MNTRSTKGFTLVEIMIVVVIIGLLAAMAIPAFQKVRTNSLGKTMLNDARQVAGAAQQMLLENPDITGPITITYNSTTGLLASTVSGSATLGVNAIQNYVSKISKGYLATSSLVYNGQAAPGITAFTLAHGQLKGTDVGNSLNTAGSVVGFDTEGKVVP